MAYLVGSTKVQLKKKKIYMFRNYAIKVGVGLFDLLLCKGHQDDSPLFQRPSCHSRNGLTGFLFFSAWTSLNRIDQTTSFL